MCVWYWRGCRRPVYKYIEANILIFYIDAGDVCLVSHWHGVVAFPVLPSWRGRSPNPVAPVPGREYAIAHALAKRHACLVEDATLALWDGSPGTPANPTLRVSATQCQPPAAPWLQRYPHLVKPLTPLNSSAQHKSRFSFPPRKWMLYPCTGCSSVNFFLFGCKENSLLFDFPLAIRSSFRGNRGWKLSENKQTPQADCPF